MIRIARRMSHENRQLLQNTHRVQARLHGEDALTSETLRPRSPSYAIFLGCCRWRLRQVQILRSIMQPVVIQSTSLSVFAQQKVLAGTREHTSAVGT
eukprot:1013582-Rhodomonas_salina.1